MESFQSAIKEKGFQLGQKIDEGAFGKIYHVKCNKTNQQNAVKIQLSNTEHPQLLIQSKIYSQLHQDPSAHQRGIPMVHSCGCSDSHNYLVMDLMGYSLEKLKHMHPNKKFSLKTGILLFDQMLSLIQYLHERGLLHRDIKPDNFCMGVGEYKHKLYLLDYGLSKFYKNKNNKHIPYRQGKSLTGTARYASLNIHKGCEGSRRDDLQSIGYVVIYLLKGTLPWQGMKTNTKFDKYKRIRESKEKQTIQNICMGLPGEFVTFMKMVRGLKFQDIPQYQFFRTLFRKLYEKMEFDYDYKYDWTLWKVKELSIKGNGGFVPNGANGNKKDEGNGVKVVNAEARKQMISGYNSNVNGVHDVPKPKSKLNSGLIRNPYETDFSKYQMNNSFTKNQNINYNHVPIQESKQAHIQLRQMQQRYDSLPGMPNAPKMTNSYNQEPALMKAVREASAKKQLDKQLKAVLKGVNSSIKPVKAINWVSGLAGANNIKKEMKNNQSKKDFKKIGEMLSGSRGDIKKATTPGNEVRDSKKTGDAGMII